MRQDSSVQCRDLSTVSRFRPDLRYKYLPAQLRQSTNLMEHALWLSLQGPPQYSHRSKTVTQLIVTLFFSFFPQRKTSLEQGFLAKALFCRHKHQGREGSSAQPRGGYVGAPHQRGVAKGCLALLHPAPAPCPPRHPAFLHSSPSPAGGESHSVLHCSIPGLLQAPPPRSLQHAAMHNTLLLVMLWPMLLPSGEDPGFWLRRGQAETSGLSGEEKASPSSVLTPSFSSKKGAYQSYLEQAATWATRQPSFPPAESSSSLKTPPFGPGPKTP